MSSFLNAVQEEDPKVLVVEFCTYLHANFKQSNHLRPSHNDFQQKKRDFWLIKGTEKQQQHPSKSLIFNC